MTDLDLSKMTESLDINKLETISIKSNVEKLELYSDTHPFSLSLRIDSFESESEYTKFVKNVESLVRKSIEYKQWKDYIIDVLGIKKCMITDEKIDECSIEVHHNIPSLFILVKAIINKKLDLKEKFSTFDIALETIKFHFENKVGYVTLVKTMHEKFHNGFLQIPREYMNGNYMSFVNEYSKYLDDADLELINSRLSVTETNCSWTRDNYPGRCSAG